MIKLMKTGPYSPRRGDLEKYDSIKLLTMYEYDPPFDLECDHVDSPIGSRLEREREFLRSVNRVVTSAQRRTMETARYLVREGFVRGGIPILHEPYLNEIKFAVEAICTRESYAEKASTAVRSGFIKAFIKDGLAESREMIKQRCDQLKMAADAARREHESVLFVSHTFFLRIFQLYQEFPDLFSRPEILREQVDETKRIMAFCEFSQVMP